LRPVNGKGGFQDVVRLQQHLAGDTVFLTKVDQIERVSRYVNRYGKGGFQNRLKPAAKAEQTSRKTP
jgi:hypothetical protein